MRTARPVLSFVTTCKSRLHHLKETLPRMAAEAGAQSVVVDYGSPDGAGDWVASTLPQVRVVRVPDAIGFNPSHARNLGAAAASGDVLCLIDADIRVAPGFAASVLAGFDPRRFYVAEPFSGDVSGTLVCARAAFEFVGGYDEACTGWGGEDIDLLDRMEFHGLSRATFPARLLDPLPHSDAERVAHHAAAKEFSNSVNLLYSHIKLDLMRLSGSRLPLDYRRDLYRQVREACAGSQARRAAVRIEVPVAGVEVNFCTLQTSLVYSISLEGLDAGDASPPAVIRRNA